MKYFTVSILQLLLVFPILSLASAEPFALPLALAKAQSSGEDCNKYCNPMSDTISKCAKAHGLLNEDGSPGPKDGTFPQEYKSCLCDADSGFSENYNK